MLNLCPLQAEPMFTVAFCLSANKDKKVWHAHTQYSVCDTSASVGSVLVLVLGTSTAYECASIACSNHAATKHGTPLRRKQTLEFHCLTLYMTSD